MSAIGHGEVEDVLRDALMSLHCDQGGPLRRILVSGAADPDDAQKQIKAGVLPACMVMVTAVEYSSLRPSGFHDAVFTIVLLLSARSFKSRDLSVRGGTDRIGVYDLLADTKAALLGRDLFDGAGSELEIVRESLFAAGDDGVMWAQEWILKIMSLQGGRM